jgi:hypothetical protein
MISNVEFPTNPEPTKIPTTSLSTTATFALSTPTSLPTPTATERPLTDSSYETEFPLPPNIDNFMKFENGSINYQTSMSLTDVVEFYRYEFVSTGYEERDSITKINDDTISIVWDGHLSGQAIVVQGVDLGNGSVNVNVRFENN